jgi:hypothetical protein
MDIAGLWRSLRTDSAEVPRPGVSRQTDPAGISLSVSQFCEAPVPLVHRFVADHVTVTVTSNRPGQPGQVVMGGNFNSAGGNYQGPTWPIGEGQFTSTTSQVQASFVLIPIRWPYLGVYAQVTWQDGTPDSLAITYVEIGCHPPIWWQWLIRIIAVTSRSFENKTSRAASAQK